MPQHRREDNQCEWCRVLFHGNSASQRFCTRGCYQAFKANECEIRTEKFCPGCNQVKPIDNFAIASRRADGHQASCKDCGVIARRTTQRSSDLKRAFGITADQYDAMLEYQGGVCAICKRECKTNRRLSVDHCHTTSEVRGLLCGNCNTGLGGLQDSPLLLQTAIQYLENPPAKDVLTFL
jgi:hypothetical protein